MKFFEHELPINPSSMTRWRKPIGEAGAEELLKETIEADLELKAVKSFQLKRVNIDTTVQEKEIRFPTDARLYDRARQRLVDLAKDYQINPRQNYNRKSKQMIYWQSRYSHARQMKREHRMDRNRLKGVEGERINAILSAVGMNFRKLIKRAADFLRQIFL